ncbi:hypothetical protein PHYSODRAFT_321621 [Phytophthora sojae]|uniref:Uncharacterized protein n=1 Tax=Phytophthora sojae (strain P6497) TaxID=1094619 RepID=G4YPC7_PHYSP|nr:hypothetical protein PHYSODRAFT_321621 [Phytophthora sojae]EGZ27907.1 hypothetical protein PHYSODRAFT_321621 [Phytophthora sojae]|eukprot:XP_009515182.1 hypothetical protein PHYSODRAFT_321621 [Phytophthora sojae]
MAFLLEEGDGSVVEAALSFLDTFGPEAPATPSDRAPDPVTYSPISVSTSDSSLDVVEKDGSDAVKKREWNIPDRRKMLRAVGVYGNSKKVRRNRRIEIAHLREQLEKLQIDLEVLKSQKGATNTVTQVVPLASHHKRTSAETVADPTMSTVWENIADSQRSRREKTECESIRLKMMIAHQQKVADNLRALIQKRASLLGAECAFLEDAENPIHHTLDLSGDLGEFQDLFYHLDSAYREVNAVFASNGLSDMVVTRSEVRVRNRVRGKYVELFFNKVLPFKLKDAAEATWNQRR